MSGAGIGVNFNSLIAPSFWRAHNDIINSKDTDPKSPTYGKKVREFFFRGGRACVDGDTLLETPNGRIKIRDFKGGEVYSFDGKERIVAYACKPLVFDRRPFYRVLYSNGDSITVTTQHQFLTRKGWMSLDSLSVGEKVCAIQEPLHGIRDLSNEEPQPYQTRETCETFSSASQDLSKQPVSNSKDARDPLAKCDEESLKASHEGVLHSMRTLLGCLYHYWHDFRLCDGLPPKEEETYLDVVRRLADAPGRNRDSSHAGDLAYGLDDTHSEGRERLHSKQDCQPRNADKCCEEKESEILRTLSESLLPTFPSMGQCLEIGNLDGSIQRVARLLLCSTVSCVHHVDEDAFARTRHQVFDSCRTLDDMLRRRVDDVSLSDSFMMNEDVDSRTHHIMPTIITSVEFVKEDNYYDLFVPFYNCYFANGVLNHNSTKSSMISLEIVRHIVENKKSNAVVMVKVAENIRDSVFQQVLWAIDHLQLNPYWKCITSPFRCTYLPTGQEILFRGLDKAGKLKGIKPAVGYFDMVWFEELTEFNGMEECRSVIQSVLRGGDEDEEVGENVQTWEFYSYNPPPTIANWVNVEASKAAPGRKVYESNYLSVSPKWLGRNVIERANALKASNPRAYAHEYLGFVTGTGGNIFNNLEIRNITDEEISTRFDNRCFGIDWGFANDPFVWLAMNYDRNHRTLYIFDEIVALGKRTQETAEMVRKKMEKIGGNCTIFADCAEPDSIADYNAWGVRVEGCPKPHSNKWSGRDYEFKALQDLTKIVIDKTYCPYTAQEFQRLEYPKNPHGDFRSEYPHTDPGDACVTGDTVVHTVGGPRLIKDLVGTEGKLLGYDINTGLVKAVSYKNCRITRRDENVMSIGLQNRTGVHCTRDHRILTPTGYVEAWELHVGSEVVCWDGVDTVRRILGGFPHEDVYDLEVPETHNFIVNHGMVIHNCRYGCFFKLRDAGVLTI